MNGGRITGDFLKAVYFTGKRGEKT